MEKISLPRVTNIENNMSTKKDIEAVTTHIDQIENEQQQIKQAVMETNETVQQFASTQNRHERILDLLSRRLIEQEAEL